MMKEADLVRRPMQYDHYGSGDIAGKELEQI